MLRKGGCKAWLKLLFLLSSVLGLRVGPDVVELWYVRSEYASCDDVLGCIPVVGGCKAWLKLLFLLSSVVGLRVVGLDVELWYVRSEGV